MDWPVGTRTLLGSTCEVYTPLGFARLAKEMFCACRKPLRVNEKVEEVCSNTKQSRPMEPAEAR